MATQAELDDPLHNLRLSISTSTPAILSTSDNPTDTTTSLANATHITFTSSPQHKTKTFPLDAPTRFAPGNQPIDLRSVYFAWTKKDASLTDYIADVQALNEELPSGAGGSVAQLSFAHRIEVLAWLNGETETSESIKPLEGAGLSVDAEKSAAIASGKAGGVAVDKGDKGKLDARLMVIYEGERKMGDQNTILRGAKPMDFSQYRALAQSLYKPSRTAAQHTTLPLPHPSTTNPLFPASNASKPRKRLEPIILLSPSASSLLRLSNIKSFLDGGVFVPANAPETSSTAGLNLLHLSRTLPSISSQPIRFILVDSTANFKPAYWDRVVAIFTTGQPWQFKSYKYTNPVELFAKFPGVYVGWQGDEVPASVAGWGRGVLSVKVDKWTGRSEGRWRDREVVETIWGRIEAFMREKGWSLAGPGTAGAR
ncbi:CDC73-domain-containing protein [Westerdykella ornata]|uniref:CDC73-domain-containing protein n=1 Tax=Westerdykella ornata TaxID=318751 RepID=A0A6A6JSB9_WESOR|nr:CDC73-domain-containing protein [Westerdykella ornata]KAF2278626.1 CDC73-domain-containing protein [Westerdykella ornata]